MSKLEILLFNHQEHFKAAKDLAFVYPISHPRRLALESEMAKMIKEIHKLDQWNTPRPQKTIAPPAIIGSQDS